MANGERGRFRVDLNRGHVDGEFGRGFGDKESRDAVDGAEAEFDPGRIFTTRQAVRLSGNLQHIRFDSEGDRRRLLGTFEGAAKPCVISLQWVTAAALELGLLQARSELRETALGAAKIGRTHC